MQNQSVIQLEQQLNHNQPIRTTIRQHLNDQTIQLRLKDYKILKFLGDGAFGEVYKGRDIINKRDVAIKLIDKDQIWKKHPSGALRIKLQRYLRTQQELMGRCHSANVVKLYDSFQNQHQKIIVMEFCQEGQLQKFIQRRDSLDQDEAIYILRQIIFGIAELHQNKIMHRDLKPANILVQEGVFKIADFGFAKELQTLEEIKIATQCGSIPTMAPQVIEGKYSNKADIWSLGMIFFIMIYPRGKQRQPSMKYNHAIRMIKQNTQFRFRAKNGQMISKQASDFLCKTLKMDQVERLNWQQTLTHPIFNKVPSKLPQHIAQSFYELSDLRNRQTLDESYTPLSLQDFEQIQKKTVSQKKITQHIDLTQLNKQFLECRKAQFIFHRILLPIQQTSMLDFQNRKHVQFMFLVTRRSNFNLNTAIHTIKMTYNCTIYQHFLKLISTLQQHLTNLFKKWSQQLKSLCDKKSLIVKDYLEKVFVNSKYIQKQTFINGFQGIDFQKKDQIDFTYDRYIAKIIIDQLDKKQDQEGKMKNILKAYRQINMLGLEDVEQKGLDKTIQEIIKSKA